jgi:hypothetical protein
MFKAFGWAAHKAHKVSLSTRGKKQSNMEVANLLKGITCTAERLRNCGVAIPRFIQILDKGSLWFLNEHFLPFQKSALTELKRHLGCPKFVKSTRRDLVATCRSSLLRNPIIRHNFRLGVSRTWRNAKEETPDEVIVDAVLDILLRKVTHRSSGCWLNIAIDTFMGSQRPGHLRVQLKHSSASAKAHCERK